MKGLWKCSLGLSLGLCVGGAFADDISWHAATARPVAVAGTAAATSPAATLGRPVAQPASLNPSIEQTAIVAPPAAVTLARPVPHAGQQPLAEEKVLPVSYSTATALSPSSVVRGRSADSPKAMPVGPPPTPVEDAPVLSMPSKVPVEPPPPGVPVFPSEPDGTVGPVPEGIVAESTVGDGLEGGSLDCVEAEGMCCDGDGCYNDGHRFYIRAAYLMWWLKSSPTPPLVTGSLATTGVPGALGQPGTVVLFGNPNLGNNFHSGLRLTAGYWFDDDQSFGIEGSGFALVQRGVHFGVGSNGTPGIFRPFFSANAGGEAAEKVAFPGEIAGAVTADLTSRLWGAEANLRGNICCGPCYRIDLIGGFRFLGLQENLQISEDLHSLTDGGGSFLVSDRFRADNRFYGGQIGAIAEWHVGRWSFDWSCKLGLGWTHEIVGISGATLTNTPGAGMNLQPGGLLALGSNIGRFDRNRFAFVPETGLGVSYQLTDSLRVFAGYDFFYWSSVVRPGQQIDRVVNTTQLPNSGVAVSGPARPAFAFRGTDFWAQGLNLGLEFRY
jgi:hypothetical protein